MENKKDLDLLIEKASKIKKENPEVFEKKLEEIKEEFDENKLEDRFNGLDDERKKRFRELYNKIENIKKNNDKEERLKLYEEMKENLSPKEQAKLQRLAKILKGMMKNK